MVGDIFSTAFDHNLAPHQIEIFGAAPVLCLKSDNSAVIDSILHDTVDNPSVNKQQQKIFE